MSAAPRDLSAAHAEMRTAELQADAALHGETIAQAGIRRARDAIDRGRKGGPVSGQMWRRMSVELRAVVLSQASERAEPLEAAAMPWEQLSEAEKLTVGSLARQWRRELDGAGWLR